MSGWPVLIVQRTREREEWLRTACEEACPVVTSYEAATGRERALAGLEARTPCIVLAPIDSSEDFETLLQIIRLFPQMPVIAVTEQPDPLWEARLIAEGADDVLVEAELDGVVLARRIRHVMERRRLRDAQMRFPLTDSLTGFMSEAAFLYLGDHKLDRAQRKGRRAVVAVIEIEGWRETLRQAGAMAADEAITVAVETIRPVLGSRNLSGRAGPSSFATLLIDAEPNALRQTVANAAIRMRQNAGASLVPLAYRFGFAESHGGESLHHLMQSAREGMAQSMIALAAGS